MPFTIEDLLFTWEQVGVFDFLLPFILVFAIVFGILHYSGIFGRVGKGINMVIALVIGLMATRFPYFTSFFSEVFPRVGVGVGVLVTLMILTGMFTTQENRSVIFWSFLTVGVVTAIIVLYNTFDVLGWVNTYGYGGSDFAAWVISAVLLIGVIIVVAIAGQDPAAAAARASARSTPVGMFNPAGSV